MRKYFFWIYVVIIVLLVVLPINSKESKVNHTYILSIRLDHIIHACLFLPWMFFYRYVKPLQLFKKLSLPAWFLLGLVFCALSEFLQYGLPYRAFNLKDVMANCTGVALSLLLYMIFKPKKPVGETAYYK